MPSNDLTKLIGRARKDRGLQAKISGAPNYESLVKAITASAEVHGLAVTREDVDEAVLELNRVQANPPDATKPTPDQERLLATSLAGFCLDFPPTTCWTDIAKSGNPCGPSFTSAN